MADIFAFYTPVAPQLSLVARFVCLFTRAGRARRRLWRTHRADDDPRVLADLHESLRGLRGSGGSENPAYAALIREILLYLTWHNLCKGLLAEASKWLRELDQHAPDCSERIMLRRQLLLNLASADQMEAYLNEAAIFLADKLLLAVDPGDAALTVLVTAYEKASRSPCKVLIDAADPGIRDRPQFRAALSLCLCPDRFLAYSEAVSWEGKIDPDFLDFSALMQADALLACARVKEYRSEWEAMESCAIRALDLLPGYCDAIYWLVRARLHRPGGDPIKGVDPRAIGRTTPDWVRLRIEIDLHQHPTLEHAQMGVEALQHKRGPHDPMERELLIVLLEKALTVNPLWTPSELAACADLCAAVEAVGARLPWTELSLAFAEIRCERRYGRAIARLKREDVLQQPLAVCLARAARILAGSPHLDPRTDHEDCFSAIESAMAAIVLPSQPSAYDKIGDLQQRLHRAADDLWCTYLPALREAVEGLLWLIGCIDHRQVSAAAPAWNPSDDAPRWLRWLHARVSLLTWNGSAWTSLLAALARDDPSVAWSVENWWSLYDAVAEETSPEIEQYRRRLDEQAWPAPLEKTIVALRRARAPGCQRRPNEGAVTSDRDGISDLGNVCSDLWLQELKIEVAYIKARRQLAADGSVSAFDLLIARIVGLSWLTRTWWEPAVNYWRGVGLLKHDSTLGTSILEGVVGGPKGPEARAQLALAAVQRQDLALGARWIAGVETRFPAVLYVQGLLEMRRGNLDQACRHLQSLVTRFGVTAIPYGPAAQRLLAAIAELQVDPVGAERIYRELLAHFPHDPIASARFGRLLCRRGYPNPIADADSQTIDRLLRVEGASINWCSSYHLLYRLSACPTEQLDSLADEIAATDTASARRFAWRQIMLRRYLAAGERTKAARLAADDPDNSAPWWYVRARLILRGWQLIEELAAEHPPSDPAIMTAATALAREIDAVPPAACDEELQQWRFLLSQAVAVAHSTDCKLDAEAWQALAPRAWAELAALWSPDETRRRDAAGVLKTMLESAGPPRADRSRLVLEAICDWILGNDEEYRKAYAALECDLEKLPVRGTSLWLAAARIAFQRREWTALLQGVLPPCVADLGDPNVRLVLGLAYARAAAEDAACAEVRSAIQKVRQAHATLREIHPADGEDELPTTPATSIPTGDSTCSSMRTA